MKTTSSSSLMLSSPVLGGQLENRRDILSDATVISADPTSTTTFLPTGSVITTTVLSSGTTITTTTTPADVSSLDDSSCDEGLHERHHHSSSSSSSSSSSFSSLSSLKKTVTAPLAGTSLAGPTWCLIWLSINCGTTLMNKAMFSSFDFPYPVTLSLVHMFFTASLAFIAMHMQGHQMKTLDRKQHLQVFLFSLLFCVNILSGNIGIKYVTVALGQVVRAAIPGITMVLSVLILRKKYTLHHVLAVLVVVLGVSTATYGDLQFHLGGFIITIISCFLSSCKSITTSIFLVGSLKFHPMELAFRMSFLAFFEMAFSAWALGEFADMSSLGYEWASSGVLVALVINGVMAFLLNHSNFMFTRSTSALTVTVAGSVKNVLTILLGIVIFVTPLSPLNAFGTFITIIGASLYSLVDFRHLEAKKASALPAPSTSTSTPSSSSVISASS